MQILTAPLWSKTEELRGRSVCSRGALGIVHCALGTVVFTVQGGMAGQLFSTSERILVANSFVSPAGLISSFSSFLYYLFSCQPALSFLILFKVVVFYVYSPSSVFKKLSRQNSFITLHGSVPQRMQKEIYFPPEDGSSAFEG